MTFKLISKRVRFYFFGKNQKKRKLSRNVVVRSYGRFFVRLKPLHIQCFLLCYLHSGHSLSSPSRSSRCGRAFNVSSSLSFLTLTLSRSEDNSVRVCWVSVFPSVCVVTESRERPFLKAGFFLNSSGPIWKETAP